MLKNLPKHLRITFNAPPEMGSPLEIPHAIPRFVGLIAAGIFAIFAYIWWMQVSKLDLDLMGDTNKLITAVFSLVWLAGWSVGVFFLAVITLVLLFYRETAWLYGGRLISMFSVGPLGLRGEYDLARIRNLRVENDPDGKTARVSFDYDGMVCSVGNMLKPEVAARNLQRLQGVCAGVSFATDSAAE